MDEYTKSSLIEVNMIQNIYTEYISYVDVKPIFEHIFKDELILLDKLARTNFMYNDTFTNVSFDID